MSARRPALVRVATRLREAVDTLSFAAPVSHVYNPLGYAWESHRRYLERFGDGTRQALLLGMNPGPFGMAQTGVPFGDVAMVRDWMGIECAVGRPPREHPKRPVTGFGCPRGEVSGRRLWGWARDAFGTPEQFFARCFVWNYCPLSFMEESGRNRTPDKLPAHERAPLYAACDTALANVVSVLGPRHVIGVGRFAADRAQAALDGDGPSIVVAPHPSPANPAANRGWNAIFERALADQGVQL
jgi:single-strand selective monofunctional uracil DNA glycosylase